MNPSDIGTLTDFAVALAGFSGIVIVIAHRGGTFSPLDGFRTISMLIFSLGAAFGSLAPLAAQSLGYAGPILWAGSNITLAVLLALIVVAIITAARTLSKAELRSTSRWVWGLCVGGNFGLIIWLLANGILLDPTPAPFVTAVIYQLFISSILFVRLLLARRTNED